jgi:hypothetical protein
VALFRRNSFTLGKFEPPALAPEPTLDELVEEGVLIAGAAVRLAVKNLVILGSLRDQVDYDERIYVAAVRDELLGLANEKSDDADRLGSVAEGASTRAGRATNHSDYRSVDVAILSRRQMVALRLSRRLRSLSEDDEYLRGLAQSAHASAWEEVAKSLEERMISARIVEDDQYRRERGERIMEVLGDLGELEADSAERLRRAASD